MNYQVHINSCLKETASKEIKELTQETPIIHGTILEFSCKDKEKIIAYLNHAQAIRRCGLSLGSYSQIEKFNPEKLNFPWSDFIVSGLNCQVIVENVKGQENRNNLSRQLIGKLFPYLENQSLKLNINFKKPDFLIIIHLAEEKYFVSIDLTGKELNRRDYRIFSHSASFKGDLAYFFIRRSGFTSKDKLLAGFIKDGTISIEASLYANKIPLLEKKSKDFFRSTPYFLEVKPESTPKNNNKIISFDESKKM